MAFQSSPCIQTQRRPSLRWRSFVIGRGWTKTFELFCFFSCPPEPEVGTSCPHSAGNATTKDTHARINAHTLN